MWIEILGVFFMCFAYASVGHLKVKEISSENGKWMELIPDSVHVFTEELKWDFASIVPWFPKIIT
jgi:hypothetical protein